jgi:hypothetical protein
MRIGDFHPLDHHLELFRGLQEELRERTKLEADVCVDQRRAGHRQDSPCHTVGVLSVVFNLAAKLPLHPVDGGSAKSD